MIILMIKLLLLMLRSSIPTPKDKNNLILVEKHTIKTQVIIEQNQKIIATSFPLGKNMIMLYLKNQSNFKKYQINGW
ncbi:hypothetical protein [Spiroplasma poulsonii]|uniref:hypothetical protein n=1 Tax=Spiroplasma poulsonii TaxID=2138 RepID=UPI001F4CA601|nr:hypothetical protein [Spiroplasma poulsonii]UNF61144.1 hypothetical protein MNU24_04295 [Spiroplasma poulsonii]